MKQSNLFTINWRDILHTFIIALGAFLLDYLQETFIPTLQISPETKILLYSGLSYIGKKFFSKPETK